MTKQTQPDEQDAENWRPQRYGFSLPGTVLNFEFSSVKLLDYRDRWDELEASQNPFAWVVMAHLKMQETRRDKPSRKVWKLRLIRRLHESGYNKTDILNVYRFIDWILSLPKPLEQEFWQELKAYEEERKMPYITTGERIGYDRGKVEARRSIAINMLNDNLPLETIARFTGVTIAQLQQLQTESL
jgi:hypothetical protein